MEFVILGNPVFNFILVIISWLFFIFGFMMITLGMAHIIGSLRENIICIFVGSMVFIIGLSLRLIILSG